MKNGKPDFRDVLYKTARLMGDIRVVEKGPEAVGKRIVRRVIGRIVGKVLWRMFR